MIQINLLNKIKIIYKIYWSIYNNKYNKIANNK